MLNMVESLLRVRPHLMGQAQLRDLACTRLVNVVNMVALRIPAFTHHTNRLAVESHSLLPTSFSGLTCSWFSTTSSPADHQRLGPAAATRNVFHCAKEEDFSQLSKSGKVVLGSVSVPRQVYGHLSGAASAGKRDLVSPVILKRRRNFREKWFFRGTKT